MTSYCRYCSTPLWREYRHNGLAIVADYYDAKVLSTVGKVNDLRITHCKGCGEQLREEVVANNTGCVLCAVLRLSN
jgi:hypothetical protein